MLFSVWLLGEQITPVAAMGAVLVLGGVAISELSMRAMPRTAPT
jgi:drug/metabolite transporter (DMT)-like permease